uniref:Uncharacterized protein n=1 Tax=Syphacia muris TaxID=451379 RepID=A0A0N5AGQ1_9BILA
MSKWETAFKNIYGRTPTKRDYTLASTVVKQDLRKRHGIPSPRKKVIRTPVKIRRPRTEEMIKFIKPKRRKLIDSSDSTPLISLLNPKTLSSSDSTDGILANNPLCNKDEIKNILQALTHEPEPVASDKCLYRSPLKPFKLLKSDNFNNIAALLFNSDEDNDCDEEELKTSEEDDLEQWPDETEILTLGKELSKEGQVCAFFSSFTKLRAY